MKKILVTGANGLIGANLVTKLCARGEEVTILVRKGVLHPFIADLDLKIAIGDLLDYHSLKNALKNINYLYHLAGFISYSYWDKKLLYKTNVTGTRNLMRAALFCEVEKVVFTSSTAAIGIPKVGQIANESFAFHPKYRKISYMDSKRKAEEIAIDYNKKGLEVVIVCPCTVIGAGDTKMNTGGLIKSVKRGKIPFAPMGGSSFLSVSDTVAGICLAMKKGNPGERYILADDNIKLIDLMNMIADKLKVKRIKRVIPKNLKWLVKILAFIAERVFKNKEFTPAVIDFSAKDRFYSSEKAHRELGWRPTQSIDAALDEAISFYQKYDFL